MSDTVAKHGLRYRLNGFPLYDDEGNLEGYAYEPKWAEADLTPEQMAEVDELVAEHLAERPQDGEMSARWGILEWNGIEHTHRKGPPVLPERPAYGWRCLMCDGYIIAENPGDFRFFGGPADGRWIVTGGASMWRVPVPRQATVLLFDEAPEPWFEVVDYERRGDAYWAVTSQPPTR